MIFWTAFWSAQCQCKNH